MRSRVVDGCLRPSQGCTSPVSLVPFTSPPLPPFKPLEIAAILQASLRSHCGSGLLRLLAWNIRGQSMIPFFNYLREKAREAVLAGVQDALDQIDPVLSQRPAPGLPAPVQQQLTSGASSTPAVSEADPSNSPATPTAAASGGIQERLAQAAKAHGANSAGNTPSVPPKPSSPKRGRGPQANDGSPS